MAEVDIDLQKAMEEWHPKAKAEAMQEIERRRKLDRKIFFCKRGPSCDGKAHEGVMYSHARGDQWPPPLRQTWFVFAMMGGRGSGKTRAGAEFTRQMTKIAPRIALVGQTTGDIRDTMIEGDSGLMAVFARYGEKIDFEPTKNRVTFPNGARAGLFTAEKPARLRGPQHHFAWLDEPAHMDEIEDVWDNLMLGLRLGKSPRVMVTTTPTPIPWVKDLIKKSDTILSRVSTYANLDNLAPTFRQNVLERYEGTRLGRQELYGEILEDVVGALWSAAIFRYSELEWQEMEKIIVAVDPAGTNKRKSDETGIIVVGQIGTSFYVLADESGKYSPRQWAEKVLDLYERYSANGIVAEKNYGGDMVKENILNAIERRRMLAPKIIVATAMRSKELRAEPVVGLYEQSRVFHNAALKKLETEQLTWIPGKGDSPNRIDALVWAITHLADFKKPTQVASPRGRRGERRMSARDRRRRAPLTERRLFS